MHDLFPSRAAGPFAQAQAIRGAPIPVTIVTGFLRRQDHPGAALSGNPEGHGTAVVVNEFGAVGIDDVLIRQSTDEVKLLGNGCLCCTTRSDLQIALRRLVSEREHGTLPPFGRVLIETSGLADPGPILQTFATDRALGGEFFVEVVAAIIDAGCGLATLDWSAEARKQVILADRLVISKTDLSTEEAVAQLIARLRELNEHAPIDTAIGGALDPRRLIEAGHDQPQSHPGFIGESGHSDGIQSFVLSEAGPLAWPPFERAMETLIAVRGSDLLRVKGFLNVTGCSGPVLVQIVQHLAHPPLSSRPGRRRTTSRLVFITRNISQDQVWALLRAVRALAVDAGEPSN